MNFDFIMSCVESGSKFARLTWNDLFYIKYDYETETMFLHHVNSYRVFPYCPSYDDIVAEDWTYAND